MADALRLSEILDPFTLISSADPANQAVGKIKQAGDLLALIGDASQPQTLVQSRQLAALAAEQAEQPLAELLSQLPPLLVVDGDVEALSVNDIKEIAIWLRLTKSPGVVIYHGGQAVAVISQRTLELALSAGAKGDDFRLYGDEATPTRQYVCRRCDPPTRRRARQGAQAPNCPSNWRHGPMDPE